MQGPEQQDFEQIKQEIVHAVALGSVRMGQDEKNVHCSQEEWSFLEPLAEGTWRNSRMTFGFRDTKDLRPITPQREKGS